MSHEWIGPAAIAGLLTALVGAYVALRKVPGERTAVLVDAASDVVVIQRGEIERLHAALEDQRKTNLDLSSRLRELENAREDLDELRDALDILRYRVAEVSREAEALRDQNAGLKEQNRVLKGEVSALRRQMEDRT